MHHNLRRVAIIVPFLDNLSVLALCLKSILDCLPNGTSVILIDDGSTANPEDDVVLAPLLKHQNVICIRHSENKGPGAARNTGLRWCWQNNIEIAILLDSDCIVSSDFVQAHLASHDRYASAICIGGAICGSGDNFWAKLDGIMSWFTSIPGSPERAVKPPLHIPTTNMSLKLTPSKKYFLQFDEHVRTGEDVAFVNNLWKAGEDIRFFPVPEVVHLDRTRFSDFIRHQYRWGLHTYIVRFGMGNLGIFRRLIFITIFFPLAPVYALLATWINMRPWLKTHTADFFFAPIVFFIYVIKAAAVIHGTLDPKAVIRDLQ